MSSLERAARRRYNTLSTPERAETSGRLQPRRISEGIPSSSFYQTSRQSRPAIATDLERSWLPGEVLPQTCSGTCISANELDQIKESIHDLVARMELNVVNQFKELQQNLQSLTTRVTKIEADICRLSEATQASQKDAEPSASLAEQHPLKPSRSRKAPIELQSRIRQVYKKLDEEQQFNLDEGIDSEWNRKVVALVEAEFPGSQHRAIRGGLAAYKRSLNRVHQEDAIKWRIKRSRKQRLWEKRCANIKDEEEVKLWKDVQPSMMSEEDSDPEDVSTFRRRRPLWRSETFNNLIDEVESRCNGSESNSKRLKKKRVQGEPLDTSAPAGAKPWMVNIASPEY